MAGIEVRSSAFTDHGPIPQRMARRTGNESPPLSWTGVPEGTRELVLLCEDADAVPTPFLHWLVTGIDPDSAGVDEGQVPPGGRQWPNDFGEPGYGGPQPPIGDNPHRYFFRLFALPAPPRLPERPGVPDVRRAVRNQLASGVLVGSFGR